MMSRTQDAGEAQRSGHGRNQLRDDAIQVGVVGAFDPHAIGADIVQCLNLEYSGDVNILHERMRAEYGVVRLDDTGGHILRWVDAVVELSRLGKLGSKAF